MPGQPHDIGELIFEDCPSLSEIIEPAMSAPPIECASWLASPEDTAFYKRVTLRVPRAAIDRYRSARAWCLFKNIKPL